jgi:hypothetical protein
MTRDIKIQSLMIAAETARGLNASRAAQLLEAAEAYIEGSEKRNRVTVFGAVLAIMEARELAFRIDDPQFRAVGISTGVLLSTAPALGFLTEDLGVDANAISMSDICPRAM